MQNIPSPETLRQRVDKVAKASRWIVNFCTVEFIKKVKATLSTLPSGHMPLDMDVFTQDNSNTKKEGVSWTYCKFNGFAPIAAWLGLEGWCLEIEQRPGSQHSQEGFIPFLLRAIDKSRQLTKAPLLVRLDSAHDAIATLVTLNSKKVERSYKDENGEEKTIKVRRVLRATQRNFEKDGTPLLIPDVEIEGWWTNLSVAKDNVIELYKGHALCEQYHSELKTDMDLERLPSGKFATNALVMSCSGLAYNILRAVGQVGLMGKKQARRAKQRRRIKTVMQDLVYFAGRFIRHAHSLTLRFSCHAHDQAQAFAKTYDRFAYG